MNVGTQSRRRGAARQLRDRVRGPGWKPPPSPPLPAAPAPAPPGRGRRSPLRAPPFLRGWLPGRPCARFSHPDLSAGRLSPAGSRSAASAPRLGDRPRARCASQPPHAGAPPTRAERGTGPGRDPAPDTRAFLRPGPVPLWGFGKPQARGHCLFRRLLEDSAPYDQAASARESGLARFPLKLASSKRFPRFGLGMSFLLVER